jgi:phospholipid/cholesterol/gamma-HCH transport system permease protein
MRAAVERLGGRVFDVVAAVGDFAVFSFWTLVWFAVGIFDPRSWRLLPRQMYQLGVLSVPMVLLTGGFVGAVLAVGSFENFNALGMAERLGTLINGAVVKEIGPVLAATMLAGRVGGALTAELGTMRVTEQIDALRVMGTDPIRYLSVPRFWCCFLMIPFLTAYTDLTGIFGGYVIVVGVYGISPAEYMYNGFQVTVFEVFVGLVKSLFFGATIGLVSCYKGFNCGQGAEGVGRACTEAFVVSFAAVLAENFVLALIAKEVFVTLYGVQSSLG